MDWFWKDKEMYNSRKSSYKLYDVLTTCNSHLEMIPSGKVKRKYRMERPVEVRDYDNNNCMYTSFFLLETS